MDRRRLLLVLAVGIALATAGCLGGGGDGASADGASGGSQDGGDGADDGGDDGGGSGDEAPSYGFFDGKEDPTASEPGTVEYRNDTYGYRMLVPDGWTQVEGAPLWYVGPDPGLDEPRRNVNVAVESVGDMTRSEYVDRGTSNVRRIMDAENLSTEAAVLGGDRATRIAFDGTFRGMQLTWIQIVAVHGDHAYTVTYVFPQGEEPGHEEELATALGGFAFLEGDVQSPAGADGSGSQTTPTV